MLTSKIVRFAASLGVCALLSFASGCAASGGGTVPAGDMKGGGGTDGGGGGNSCSPGQARSCICLGGGDGTQVCRDTGTSYGSCTGCSGDAGTITVADGGGGNPCGDCQGCCDGTTCILFGEETNTQCGATGTTCTSCGSQTCNTADGTCVTQGSGSCSAANCNGCCGTLNGVDHCYVDTTSACGSGGGACTACTSGTTCSGGSCSNGIDPNHMFKVTIQSLQIYNTDGMSNCWDNNGFGYGCGQPDPYVCFGYDVDSTGAVTFGCTGYQNDIPIDNGKADTDNAATDSTTWSGTDGVLSVGDRYSAGGGFNDGTTFYIPGSAFIDGKVLLKVSDYDDVSGDDIIASKYIQGSQVYSAYSNGPFGRMVKVVFTIE